MRNIFFWSDPHFHHTRIIELAKRPFTTAEEMEDELVRRHNSVVKPGDSSYCLGDFSILRKKREYPEVVRVGKRLNGDLRLILGNHDHCPVTVYLEAGFEKIYGVWGGIDHLLLSHIPIHPTDMGRFRACLHGHIHGHASPPPVVGRPPEFEEQDQLVRPYLNMSVENINYTPVSLDEINDRIRALQTETLPI